MSATHRVPDQHRPVQLQIPGQTDQVGTAWTLLTAELLGEPPPRAVPPMSMPDLMVLDLGERTVLSPWGGWRDRGERE